MAYYYEPMQLRASSSAFQWGRMTYTHYKTGCLRKILLQSRDIQAVVASKYGNAGKYTEDRHASKLESSGVMFDREVPFREELGLGVHLSGHADFLLYRDGKPDSVDELKSVQSKTVRREVIKKGLWNVENLAQLVAYMSAFDVLNGRLIYVYVDNLGTADTPQWTAMDERIFAVAIDEHYRIFVDSKPTQYTVFDLYAHQKAASEVIAKGTIADRPNNWDAPFVSPCGYCAFKSACDAYDSNAIEGTESFVQQCRNLVGSDT